MLRTEIRHALRSLSRRPPFVAGAAGMLGLVSRVAKVVHAADLRLPVFAIRPLIAYVPRATDRHITGIVIRDGVSLALTGLVPGVALALLAAATVGRLLFRMSTLDLATWIAVAVVVAAATVAASWPARAARRTEPLAALRVD